MPHEFEEGKLGNLIFGVELHDCNTERHIKKQN